MKTLYNSAGEAKTMDFVDAREHLETGRWFESAPVIESPTADVAPPADVKGAVLGDSDSSPCLDEIQGEAGTRPDNAEAGIQIDGQGLEPCLTDNTALTKAELLEKLAALTDIAKPAMSKAELLDLLNELEAGQ